MTWFLANWRLIGFLAVLGALGVQSYRLQGTQGEYRSYKLEAEAQEKERQTEVARTAAFDRFNKRRTDETYRADLARIARGGLLKPSDQSTAEIAPATGGGDQAAVCFGRRELNSELSGFAQRERDRLEELLGTSLKVLAAYRACKSWADALGTLQQDEGPTPPRAPSGGQTTGRGVVAAVPGL